MNIVIEGPDGSGKTSLIEYIKEKHPEFEYYKHPGSTDLGKEIRKILLERKDIEVSIFVEQMLMLCDNLNYIDKCLKPAMENGKTIINDRNNIISGTIYGLAGNKEDKFDNKDLDDQLNIMIDRFPPIDLLIILIPSFETIIKRLEDRKEKDKFESRDIGFKKKIWRSYNNLSNYHSLEYLKLERFFKHIKIIKTDNMSYEDIYCEIKNKMDEMLLLN